LKDIVTVGAGVEVGVTGVTGAGVRVVVPLQAKPVVMLYPEVEVQPAGSVEVVDAVPP
jgi:hypothetical protein